MARVEHQVPKGYLNRFSDDELVSVRWRNGKVYESNTRNVAAETGFYDLPEGIPLDVETEILDPVDSRAIAALRSIDETGTPPAKGSPERMALLHFVALQMQRTSGKRDQVMFPSLYANWARDKPLTEETVADFLESEHLGYRPDPDEAEAAWVFLNQVLGDSEDSGEPDRTFAISIMLETARQLVPLLDALHWTLELDRKAGFITSDTPVVVWKRPSGLDNIRGIGIQNADEVRFPIDPGQQLVFSRQPRTPVVRVPAERARRCNQDMATGCHRFLIGHPRQAPRMGSITLAKRPPVTRFAMSTLLVPNESGGSPKRAEGDLLQMWVPRGSHVAHQAARGCRRRPRRLR